MAEPKLKFYWESQIQSGLAGLATVVQLVEGEPNLSAAIEIKPDVPLPRIALEATSNPTSGSLERIRFHLSGENSVIACAHSLIFAGQKLVELLANHPHDDWTLPLLERVTKNEKRILMDMEKVATEIPVSDLKGIRIRN